jgi:hypothetical protein
VDECKSLVASGTKPSSESGAELKRGLVVGVLPCDPVARAHLRNAVIYFDEKVRPFFYQVLMRPDAEAGPALRPRTMNTRLFSSTPASLEHLF